MSLYGAFDTTAHLSELDNPLVTNEGVLTPAQRRARVLANLFVDGDSNTIQGTLTFNDAVTFSSTVTRAGLQLTISAAGHAKLGGSGAGWVIDADNATPLVTLPASQTSEVLLIPITGLRVGDTITGVGINGQVESAGGNVTLALDVRKVTGAAAGFSDASLATDNVGTLTADTLLSAANLGVTGLTEVLAAEEIVYVTLTGTTAASTDIEIYSVSVTYTGS